MGWFSRRQKPKPPRYLFGTVLQHKNNLGPHDPYALSTDMRVLKSMYIGESDLEGRIQVIRLAAFSAFIGEIDEVFSDSWEPVDV